MAGISFNVGHRTTTATSPLEASPADRVRRARQFGLVEDSLCHWPKTTWSLVCIAIILGKDRPTCAASIFQMKLHPKQWTGTLVNSEPIRIIRVERPSVHLRCFSSSTGWTASVESSLVSSILTTTLDLFQRVQDNVASSSKFNKISTKKSFESISYSLQEPG